MDAFEQYWQAKGEQGSSPEQVARLAWVAAQERMDVEKALERVQEAQSEFWNALRELETLTAEHITQDIADWEQVDMDMIDSWMEERSA